MLAPVISGQLFYFIGYIWTGVFIAAWNILSVVCEYMLLSGIYKQYPRLAQKISCSTASTNNIETQVDDEETCHLSNDTIEKQAAYHDTKRDKKRALTWRRIIPRTFRESFAGWQMYFEHPVRNKMTIPVVNSHIAMISK